MLNFTIELETLPQSEKSAPRTTLNVQVAMLNFLMVILDDLTDQ